jgi:hypothetical protein
MTFGPALAAALTLVALGVAPAANADNKRLNESVFVNIYTAQRQNGCSTEPKLDGRLVEAARRHTLDVLDHSEIGGDIGSDGSTAQDRANAAGFLGKASETIAINPALAISGIEILSQFWNNPAYQAIMKDCSNTAIGVCRKTAWPAASWKRCTASPPNHPRRLPEAASCRSCRSPGSAVRPRSRAAAESCKRPTACGRPFARFPA